MGTHRDRVADFWDLHVAQWLAGQESWTPELREWFDSYRGQGAGQVDLSCFPDPYVGDLRGLRGQPQVVVLGLNPGVGYPRLQGREGGIWSERIRSSSYSHCMDRSPHGDQAWLDLHGRPSRYWQVLMRWARAWTRDQGLLASQVLNFELYPWHSNAITAPITPPADVVDRYIWQPISEIDTESVFAFGKPWVAVCQQLGLPVLRWHGPGHETFPGPQTAGWNVVTFALQSGQRAVVSWQPGYAGPPGQARTATLRRIVSDSASEA